MPTCRMPATFIDLTSDTDSASSSRATSPLRKGEVGMNAIAIDDRPAKRIKRDPEAERHEHLKGYRGVRIQPRGVPLVQPAVVNLVVDQQPRNSELLQTSLATQPTVRTICPLPSSFSPTNHDIPVASPKKDKYAHISNSPASARFAPETPLTVHPLKSPVVSEHRSEARGSTPSLFPQRQPLVVQKDEYGLYHDESERGVATPLAPARTQFLLPNTSHRDTAVTAPTSPQNFRLRARALSLKLQPAPTFPPRASSSKPSTLPYFSVPLNRRPYLRSRERDQIVRGSRKLQRVVPSDVKLPHLLHVDLFQNEIELLDRWISASRYLAGGSLPPKSRRLHPYILQRIDLTHLPGRSLADIENYLQDWSNHAASPEASILLLEDDPFDRRNEALRASRMQALLLGREMIGHRSVNLPRQLVNFPRELKTAREEGLELVAEWTDCAGDISTISWTSQDAFICGTTTHSDSRNQQYNKPGNLLLGSSSYGSLKSYPDHRIIRPLVVQGENSTEAMRQSQDPWLYTSVVSSDFDHVHKLAYTSSFDKTARVWGVEKSGSHMTLLGTWPHQGNVNFVVASKHPDVDGAGLVATAADVPLDAVRVYKVDEQNISASPFQTFSCSRIVDAMGNPIFTDKWAYFPATIRWGLAKQVRHLFLVGYSPRSLTNDDNDIPEDRRDSGELCLWNGLTGEKWKLTGATVQNVFEVAWHPTQPCFIVASSPKSFGVEDGVHTQIRIFEPSKNPEFDGKAFCEIQVLDCLAVDINELAIMSNSPKDSFVAAGCTDGKTYIWDSARGDKPVHVLSHGPLVEEQSGTIISVEDTGVKFIAWGNTPDRFYTGSSDGVVKVWNIRSSRKPLVRDLLECPAPVSFGAFSPDASKLVIGDASGRVFLLSVDEDEDSNLTRGSFVTVKLPDGNVKTVRRPRLFVHHPPPEPPNYDDGGKSLSTEETGVERARNYLSSGQLEQHKNPTIGAVQGPKYRTTGLYRKEAHFEEDPALPLLARIENAQQENIRMFPTRQKPLRDIKKGEAEQHTRNLALDFDVLSLNSQAKANLVREKAELDDDGYDYDFEYEELPDELEFMAA